MCHDMGTQPSFLPAKAWLDTVCGVRRPAREQECDADGNADLDICSGWQLFTWAIIAAALLTIAMSWNRRGADATGGNARHCRPIRSKSGFDAIVATLDRVGGATRADSVSEGQLDEWREEIAKLRDDLAGASTPCSRAFTRSSHPQTTWHAAGGRRRPEAPAIAAERARLDKLRGELDANLKQANLLSLRTDEVGQRITERRRTISPGNCSSGSPAFSIRRSGVEIDGGAGRDARDIAELGQT